jgi:DNA-binding MarR family transcriptional regulator
MKNTTPMRLSTPPVQLPCTCANLRKAARAVTQFYDRALRPSGLLVTQFTLLQALTLAQGSSQKQLAELLAMDSTTLTRTLGGLRRKGWVRAATGVDRRQHRLSLTAAGRKEYKRVLPYWQSAQKRLRRALGETGWNRVVKGAVESAGVAAELVALAER